MMGTILNNILRVLPMIISISCAKVVSDYDIDEFADKTFSIAATRSSDGTSTTMKNGYEYFDDGNAIRIGLFSLGDDGKSLKKYSDLLVTDIYATYNATDNKWVYGYGREGNKPDVAYKEVKTDDTPPILAACYPYRDARDLKNIPFSLSDKQGLMYATPVNVDDDNRYNIPLEFHHSMAKINIKVNFKHLYSTSYSGYNPKKPNLFDIKACEGTDIVGSAMYDSTDGTFKDKKMVDCVSLITYTNIPNKYGSYIIIDDEPKYDVTIYLVPEDNFKGFDIRLSWQGGTDSYGNFHEYDCLEGLTIDQKRIQIEDLYGTETKLMAGYEYNYTIEVNNYLKFQGITIDTNWIEEQNAITGKI